jgi:hypothetical protein
VKNGDTSNCPAAFNPTAMVCAVVEKISGCIVYSISKSCPHYTIKNRKACAFRFE